MSQWGLGICVWSSASVFVHLPLFLSLQVLLLFPVDYFILLHSIALNKVLHYSVPSSRKKKIELRVSSNNASFLQVNLSGPLWRPIA